MKKICFAIFITLFGLTVAYALNFPMGSLLFAIVGLVLAITGYFEKEEK